MRAADPAALGAWYRDCLGLDADENGLWHPGAGMTDPGGVLLALPHLMGDPGVRQLFPCEPR